MEFAYCTQDALGVLVNEHLRIAFAVSLAGSRIFTHREKVGQELRDPMFEKEEWVLSFRVTLARRGDCGARSGICLSCTSHSAAAEH